MIADLAATALEASISRQWSRAIAEAQKSTTLWTAELVSPKAPKARPTTGPTSRRRKGSFKDSECETPDWSSSGATTQTSSDKARAISSRTLRPGAWMPSSLVQRMRMREVDSESRLICHIRL